MNELNCGCTNLMLFRRIAEQTVSRMSDIKMYFEVLFLLLLVNNVPAILIGENDVTCLDDGSVSIKKSALGSLSSRIYAFGGAANYGYYGHCHRVVREDVVQFRRSDLEVPYFLTPSS